LRSLPSSIKGLWPNSKTEWGALHIAHDAPLEMPDRSRAEHLHLRAAGAQAGAAGREMIDQLFKHALV
jgi:hypothetical protein